MTPVNINPDHIAKTLTLYVKSLIQILVWLITGITAVAAACIVLSGIWAAVKFALKILF